MHCRQRGTLLLASAVDNLSMAGMFVRSDAPLPQQALVSVELLDAPPNAPLRLSARVVWNVTKESAQRTGLHAGVALAFEWMPDATRQQLRALLGRFALARPPERPRELDRHQSDAARLDNQLKTLAEQLQLAEAQLIRRHQEIELLRAEMKRSRTRLTPAKP